MTTPLSGQPVRVGILVANVDEAVPRYRALVGREDWLIVENGPRNMHGPHVRGEGEDVLREWLDRRGGGLHHLGYRVDSID